MDGIFVKREKIDFLTEDNKDLFLLLRQNGVEIMLQPIQKDSYMWITPPAEKTMVEFFYILNGNLTLEANDEEITLHEHDCFYTKDLQGKVLLKSNTDLKLLYISTGPVFELHLDDFYENLNHLIDKIAEKDEYTKGHCSRVADYCLFISKKLNCTGTVLDNLVLASKFHDVGKCFVPDEILQKKGRLTTEEFKEIYKHPTFSKKLLTGKFSPEVVKIAYEHHERLDGSGYPCGLRGDQISIETRIIAVADSFDAMTTKRPYNNEKTYEEAADELCLLTNKYDKEVTMALKDLVDSGELRQMLSEVRNDRI